VFDVSVIHLTYEDFVSKSHQTPDHPLTQFLVGEKTIHVFALSRDLCSGCQIQKPLYEKLADRVNNEHGDRVRFYSIHLSNQQGFSGKREDFRKVLKFAAYPTYLILMRTDFGAVEAYRAIEPPMEDIERNIALTLEFVNR
jgi:hypothetical protein